MATLHGTCLCGGVRFEVDETPDRVRFCHCESCKKLAGGGSTANFRAASASIRIVEGGDLVRTYQPADGSAKTFCGACGSNLFGGGWPGPGAGRAPHPPGVEPAGRPPRL